MKSRIIILFAGLLLLLLVVLVRGAMLQLGPNQRLEALRNRQFETAVALQERRGAILDRSDRDLAVSTLAHSLYADPHLIRNKKDVAKKLAPILGMTWPSLYAKIKDPTRRFIWLSRTLPEEKFNLIHNFELEGIQFVDEYKRFYPNSNIASSILGSIGNDGNGLEGVELSLDEKLRGSKKKLNMRRDARGRPLFSSDGNGFLFTEMGEGSEVKLTIDTEIQHQVETELSETVKEYDADQGFAVILNAATSEIIAMSNTPQYDANNALKMPIESRRIRSIGDAFEPGSTMKTFIIASALEQHLIAPNTKINTENGRFELEDRVIKEAEMKEHWASLSVSEVLAYSSNIGSSKIALMMGSEKVRSSLTDFGFGDKTGVQLPGEGHGSLQPLPWRPHLLANISFGQGIAVTPLQIANAYAVIANGGLWHRPSIVKSFRDVDSGIVTPLDNHEERRILSPEIAMQVRMMLLQATSEGGTGENARIEGFPVAGKTGTAQKSNPKGRGYLPGAYIASFAGFFPANDPKYVVYVAIDHPKKPNSYYGAQIAAPLFAKITSYVARQAGLAPTLLTEKNVSQPQFLAKLHHGKQSPRQKKIAEQQAKQARQAELASKKRLAETAELEAKNAALNGVTGSLISTDTLATTDAVPAVAANAGPPARIPNLKNLTFREVLENLRTVSPNLYVKVHGQGTVDRTEPAENEEIPNSRTLQVYMSEH